jgi:hypothetical protein
MCTHFPAVIDISERLTLLKEVLLLFNVGILDNRRSAKDKVELLPQHPGSEIFVANRFLWRLCTAYSIPRQEITHLHYHQH